MRSQRASLVLYANQVAIYIKAQRVGSLGGSQFSGLPQGRHAMGRKIAIVQ